VISDVTMITELCDCDLCRYDDNSLCDCDLCRYDDNRASAIVIFVVTMITEPL
jgi:hypothetical protein